MRTKITLLVLLVSVTSLSAQTLSWKSNYLHLNYKQPIASNAVFPHITWISPELDYSSIFEGKVTVRAKVESAAALTGLKLVFGNSKTNEIISQRTYNDVKGMVYTVEQPISLVSDGMFYIELIASTETGGTVSGRRNIIAGKDALDYVAADRKDYALIFATDNYDNWTDLVNPIHDAQSIAKELTEQYGFTVEVITNAEYEEVFEKLRDYNERNFKPQDQLLVFFAGHGMFDETFGEGFVVARNSAVNDKSRASYISHSRLRGIIDNIPCQHILLMMDVCFGGTLDPVIARARSAAYEVSEREMLARKFSYKTRKYLTSGGKEYVSDGIPGKHSPFAAKLIESLRSYGGDDRILTLTELQVNMEKLKQLPRFGSFGSDEKLSDFVFVAKSH